MKDIAIIFIGTGPYISFFDGFYRRVQNFFCPSEKKTIYAFTDQTEHESLERSNVVIKEIKHVGWPYITLHRFKFMNQISKELKKHSHVFFIDADLWPVDHILSEEILKDDFEYVTVQHPGFVNKIGTFEDNENSTAHAYNQGFDLSIYRQGCFWGGTAKAILRMVSILDKNVDKDTSKDIVAKWHDESHMNRYFLENSDQVRTLDPGYATPEAPGYEHIWSVYDVKMVHLNKDPNSFPRFEGGKKK